MGIGELLYRFILALGIGMLMGVERDHNWRSESDEKKLREQSELASKKFSFIKSGIPARGLGGMRTYSLISILGALSGLAYRFNLLYIPLVVFVLFSLFILASFILNYFDKNSFGLTTEISIMTLFLISMMMLASDVPVKLLVAIAIISILILSLKTEVHGFVSLFSGPEIVDTLKFILVTFVILPFLPDRVFTLGDILPNLSLSPDVLHMAIINPFQIWLMVVIISSINFIAYFAVKAIGGVKGVPLAGFLGGLVSSTAVTQAMASKSKDVKDTQIQDTFVVATILANLTSFWRILLVALIFNAALAERIFIPMVVMSGVLTLFVIFLNKKDKNAQFHDFTTDMSYKSPFSIGPALRFAILFFFVSLFTKIGHLLMGNSGFVLSSMISAFSGLDAITINTASSVGSIITMDVAVLTLVGAAIANLLIKIFIVIFSADGYFRKKVNGSFLLASAAGALTVIKLILEIL